MRYIIITGGVASGIGKGCLSAVLGRIMSLSGIKTNYQKLEPCLQNDMHIFENTHFGEIIVEDQDICYDGDVARAKFYIPNFEPNKHSDFSLGNLFRIALGSEIFSNSPAPKITEVSYFLKDILKDDRDTVYVIEIGGTSGEVEQKLFQSFIQKSFGKPLIHLHLTTCVSLFYGCITTKPAQISINNLLSEPDFVFVRNAAPDSIRTLQKEFGENIVFIPVKTEEKFPEGEYYIALQNNMFKNYFEKMFNTKILKDNIFILKSPQKKVAVIHDGADKSGYQSLYNRLLVWSEHKIEVIFINNKDIKSLKSYDGIVLIGEEYFEFDTLIYDIPYLDIRFIDKNLSRNIKYRPDWLGTADFPFGDIQNFINKVLNLTKENKDFENAYHDETFAHFYIAESENKRLRDHSILDDYIWGCFGLDDEMKNSNILDIGCGTGRWAEQLSKTGAHIVGIEPAKPMYLKAKEKLISNFKIYNESVEHFSTELKFDYIIASMSLDHCSDLDNVILKCSHWLNERGRLIISTEHPIRTAPTDERWIEIDGKRRGLIYNYGDEGIRNYFWFKHNTPVKVFHHKLETWISSFNCANLNLVALKEPVSIDQKDANIPRFWLLVAEKKYSKSNIVTIDGISRTGKTTIGDKLSEKLGFLHIDTGLIIRFFLYLHESGKDNSWHFEINNFKLEFFIENKRVNSEIISENLALKVSKLSNDNEIRKIADKFIYEIINGNEKTGCIVTGRAMGKKLKNAKLKICLICKDEKRNERSREIETLNVEREKMDTNRYSEIHFDISAKIIDTSSCSIENIVTQISNMAELIKV